MLMLTFLFQQSFINGKATDDNTDGALKFTLNGWLRCWYDRFSTGWVITLTCLLTAVHWFYCAIMNDGREAGTCCYDKDDQETAEYVNMPEH